MPLAMQLHETTYLTADAASFEDPGAEARGHGNHTTQRRYSPREKDGHAGDFQAWKRPDRGGK